MTEEEQSKQPLPLLDQQEVISLKDGTGLEILLGSSRYDAFQLSNIALDIRGVIHENNNKKGEPSYTK